MRVIPPSIVIIGGGIAGLSAAWECHTQRLPALVLEAQPRAGGVIRTERVGEFVLDTGPDAFLVSKPGAIGLCRELGIEHRLITMKQPRGAYVLRDGRLHALPEGGAFGIATRPGPFLRSAVLSPAGKLRVALEPLVPRRRSSADESAGAFFRRRFGDEAARRIAQPLLGGIHAGDLDRLSVHAVLPQLAATERAGRSVLLALRAQARSATEAGAFRSFAEGMEALVASVVERLPASTLRLGDAVQAITQVDNAWRIRTAAGSELDAEVVVLAVPADRAAHWLGPLDATAAGLTAGIRYVSSAGVLAVYRSEHVTRPLRGSGYVATPEPGRDPLLATSWLSSKWDGRAPDGFTVLRGFFGGAFDEGALARPDADLVDEAHRSWQQRFGIVGGPHLTRLVRWERASPQHEVGHRARVGAIDARLAALPGLAVAGSGFRAVGIPDVIADARATVAHLLDRYRTR